MSRKLLHTFVLMQFCEQVSLWFAHSFMSTQRFLSKGLLVIPGKHWQTYPPPFGMSLQVYSHPPRLLPQLSSDVRFLWWQPASSDRSPQSSNWSQIWESLMHLWFAHLNSPTSQTPGTLHISKFSSESSSGPQSITLLQRRKTLRHTREKLQRKRNGGWQAALRQASFFSSELSPQSSSPSHRNRRLMHTPVPHWNSLAEQLRVYLSQWDSSEASGQSFRRSHQKSESMQVPSWHLS